MDRRNENSATKARERAEAVHAVAVAAEHVRSGAMQTPGGEWLVDPDDMEALRVAVTAWRKVRNDG